MYSAQWTFRNKISKGLKAVDRRDAMDPSILKERSHERLILTRVIPILKKLQCSRYTEIPTTINGRQSNKRSICVVPYTEKPLLSADRKFHVKLASHR